MINSITFLKGYPSRFSLLGNKKYGFNDRINIVIGPNGSGKTTLLNAVAQATGCADGGWSDSSKIHYPFAMELVWDGKPVFYQDCFDHSDTSFISSTYFTEKRYLRSTGEKRIGMINELIDHLENRFLTYALPTHERPTLLLDEVDNHIGFIGQAILWKHIFPLLSKKYQLIISSHSVFPILLKKNGPLRNDTIIALSRTYDTLCITELAAAIDFYNQNDSGDNSGEDSP